MQNMSLCSPFVFHLCHYCYANSLALCLHNLLGVCVTFGNIYQEYNQYLCPHVDPHLSLPTAQQWVSMCIRLICVHIDHLEVLAGYRNGIINAPEGFLCYFNESPFSNQCIDLF